MDQHVNSSAIIPKCVCLDEKLESCRLHYGRFAISPFLPGQAITVGTAIRRALLGDVKGASIISAYVVGASHEYCTLQGVRESVHDILLNLKEIIVKTNTLQPQTGIILFQGPGIVTAEHIQLPSSVEVVDKTQYIAKVETPTQLEIHLIIQKSRGWQMRRADSREESTFSINAILKPVRNINYSIHSVGEGQTLQELLILELWTNGALTPQEALSEASYNLTLVFQPFLYFDKKNINKQNTNVTQPTSSGTFDSNYAQLLENKSFSENQTLDHFNSSIHLSKWLKQESIYNSSYLSNQLETVDKTTLDISIDCLELPIRASNCLKKAGVHSILQLLQYTQEDLLKLKNLGKRSAEQIVKALQQRFGLYLSNK